MKHIPNVAELNLEREIYKTLLCSSFNWSEGFYNTIIEAYGIYFLDHKINSEQAKKTLMESKMYWNWFCLKWHERDYEMYNISPELTPEAYLITHETQLLNSSDIMESFRSKLDAMLKIVG